MCNKEFNTCKVQCNNVTKKSAYVESSATYVIKRSTYIMSSATLVKKKSTYVMSSATYVTKKSTHVRCSASVFINPVSCGRQSLSSHPKSMCKH